MPDELSVQITWMIWRFQRETEIIHRKDVFEQLGLIQVANPAGLARGIKRMREGIRARVELMIILRFVDAYSPENYGGMVPIPPDHASHIVNCKVLPLLVSSVLPARDLLKHQESKFITGVKKMRRLRVMRCPDDIAFEFFLEDFSVAALHACGHSLTHERESLMAVETAKLDHSSVQFKTALCELCLAKTETAPIFIERWIPLSYANSDTV